MPARDSAPAGAPCWIDLFSSDPDRAEEFYGEIFGWTAEHTLRSSGATSTSCPAACASPG